MARPKKSSNYKVIQDIDLSKNNIYNVNAIVGNSYDFEPNDLIITTYDTDADPTNLPSNAGNLILRAGVADKDLAYSGSVHIFAGNEVEPNEDSTVLDTLASSVYSPLNGKSSRVKNGITVDPDEGVFIKSEILVDREAGTKTGTVSIEANENLNIKSKNQTTESSIVTKTVTTETDTVGTLEERFASNHTETAKELNVSAGGTFKTTTVAEDGTEKSVTDYSSMENPTLTIQSNFGKTDTDQGHSYINVDKIEVDKTVTEGKDEEGKRVVRKTFTSSDTNTSELYDLHAGSSNPSDATLTIESNHKENEVHTEHSYINVDKILVDKTVNEGTSDNRVDREVYATTDTTDVSEYLKIDAPGFKLNAGSADGKTETASLEVTNITSIHNDLENLTLGGKTDTPTGKIPNGTGSFVVDNNSVDIDTNTLSINVPNNLHEDTPTVGTVFELSANTTSSPSSSSMHIDEVKIDDKLFIGEEVVTTDSATGIKSTSIKKSKYAKIYTNEFVLDTKDGATGLSITGKHDLEITDHKEIPQTDTSPKAEESFINVNHIDVGTVDVDNDNAKDVLVSKSIKTTGATVDVKLTSNSENVSVNNGDTVNKIRDVEIHSETINIKGGSKNNLHITSSLTKKEADERLKTKGLNEGDSFIETDDLRVNKNFYANQFYIYWDDSINSLVFANSEHTPKV